MRKEIIKRILDKQKSLDQLILLNAGISVYPKEEITIAFNTELGELSNEIPEWKYWKKNKKINKEKQLDELVDCIHFTASLMNYNRDLIESYEINKDCNIVQLLSAIYILAPGRKNVVMVLLFAIGNKLGFTDEKIEEGYNKKNKINYQRQYNNY